MQLGLSTNVGHGWVIITFQFYEDVIIHWCPKHSAGLWLVNTCHSRSFQRAHHIITSLLHPNNFVISFWWQDYIVFVSCMGLHTSICTKQHTVENCTICPQWQVPQPSLTQRLLPTSRLELCFIVVPVIDLYCVWALGRSHHIACKW